MASQDRLLVELTAIYKDLHRQPELSMHEVRTAKRAADELAAHGFEVTAGVGGTGVRREIYAVAALVAAAIEVTGEHLQRCLAEQTSSRKRSRGSSRRLATSALADRQCGPDSQGH